MAGLETQALPEPRRSQRPRLPKAFWNPTPSPQKRARGEHACGDAVSETKRARGERTDDDAVSQMKHALKAQQKQLLQMQEILYRNQQMLMTMAGAAPLAAPLAAASMGGAAPLAPPPPAAVASAAPRPAARRRVAPRKTARHATLSTEALEEASASTERQLAQVRAMRAALGTGAHGADTASPASAHEITTAPSAEAGPPHDADVSTDADDAADAESLLWQLEDDTEGCSWDDF